MDSMEQAHPSCVVTPTVYLVCGSLVWTRQCRAGMASACTLPEAEFLFCLKFTSAMKRVGVQPLA
eukprot:1146916-Pelagomonas_calceolata.AAC.7